MLTKYKIQNYTFLSNRIKTEQTAYLKNAGFIPASI